MVQIFNEQVYTYLYYWKSLFKYTHVTLIPCLVITDIEKEHSSFYKNFFSYKIFFYGINEKSKKIYMIRYSKPLYSWLYLTELI